MSNRIGQSGSLAREALLAALKEQTKSASHVQDLARTVANAATPEAKGVERTDFADKLEQGIQAVQDEIQRAEQLPSDLVTGKIDDFHEVAVQLKKADLTFRYAMEVRNKLLDAYREVMRMNV